MMGGVGSAPEPVVAERFAVEIDPLQRGPIETYVTAVPFRLDPLVFLNLLDLGVQVGLEFFPIHRPLPSSVGSLALLHLLRGGDGSTAAAVGKSASNLNFLTKITECGSIVK